MKRSVLVVGGAGYIGSHMVRLLIDSGHEVVVLDNLSQGHRAAIGDAELVVGDLMNTADLAAVFAGRRIDAVIHFAALIAVGESVVDPGAYYRNNVTGTLNLLDAMRNAGVDKLVFSSTAAVFGNPRTERLSEDHPLAPINPYGWSKRMIEQVLADMARAWGLNSVALRYFNAAGAHRSGQIGEAHTPETHLIPVVLLAALGLRNGLQLFGDDYDTPDGTCVRDYVHVCDLAMAHLKALEFMHRAPGAHAFNLGNGSGFSNREVVKVARSVTGRPIPVEIVPRRQGDPARLVADGRRARDILGWRPEYPELGSIIESAWAWHQSPLYGPFASPS
ncbi:UDP-glucose 4-epimerase GalE [Meridianimarinicoccus roseus]|uniref:UDP-glucose 4-epimerase n=1 Tax=Meridianimarinicoccus roseus TaxID=2072018 RepID=A0A2V2LDQ5_9RHOB|nr:UDP-glucose 4-epimerase GalE [Meridianimarinicoccus roseus]PWR03668.1 UDP-glucose 4-epimerase GalE [Meridianimarinicoccus roseus]